MKKVTSFLTEKAVFVPFILLLLCGAVTGCSDEKLEIAEDENKIEYQTKASTSSTNLPFFNPVSNVEAIQTDENIEFSQIMNEINTIGDYDLNLQSVEKIKLTDVVYDVYSIPFNDNPTKRLVALVSDYYISVVLASNETLANGHEQYVVQNSDHTNLLIIEQNNDNLFGNIEIFDAPTGFYHRSQLIGGGDSPSDPSDGYVVEGSCLDHSNFNRCMQCAWDQCSSSWVCGAVLAIKPLEIIAASVALCGANTILRVH